MSTEPLKVGMIGVGHFGAARRARMRETGRFDIVAVCDRDTNILAKAAGEEDARPVESYEQLLEVDGLEGMVISTGADTHAQFSIQAMDRGLHVFVEKPLCTSIEQINALRSAQRRTGRVVGVGHGHHDEDAAIRAVRALREQGYFGTEAAYEENTSHSGGLHIKPGDWRGKAEANPGGMLFQCGVHSLHRLTHLFGPIESVSAMMRYDANPNTETADAACVILRHESGMLGTLNAWHITAYNHNFRLFGTGGNLYFDTFEKIARLQPSLKGPREPLKNMDVPPAPGNAAHLNLLRWVDAVQGLGDSPSPSLEDGINAVLPVFAAEIAAKEKREVRLAELLDQLA